jgi:L-malate glycosyltransferase
VLTLHIDTERTWRGGEQQVLYLLEGLRSYGVPSVLLAQPNSPLFERARAAGVDVRELRVRGEADLESGWRIARLVEDESFDLVHCHTSHAHSIALAARVIAKRRDAPKIVVARRVDFSIFRHSFLHLNGIKYRRCDRIVAVSQRVKDVLTSDGIAPEIVSIVRDGIDVERISRAPDRTAELRARYGIGDGQPLILNVAHMAHHKGQCHLVDAMPAILAERPDARTVVVGHGELRESLEARARGLGLGSRLVFAGFQPPDEIPSFLKAADVFAFPSVEEGLGSSLLDAMAAGVPIVASRAGGIPEIIRDDETGVLVEPGDPGALARGILRLLNDRAAARRIASAATCYVRTQGTKERMVEETAVIYRRTLASAVPSPA